MGYIDVIGETKRYVTGATTIVANKDVTFSIDEGELVVILGASGAGKSTVLNILGGMDTCSEGQVVVDGKDIVGYDARQLTTYRRYDVGFVFQFYNLVANLTRAVAKNPKILLCDEPTGALDYRTGKQVLRILQDQCRKHGATVVIVTHNAAIAPIADRVIRMHDARVQSVETNSSPEDIDNVEW